jgi:hypothetical protein
MALELIAAIVCAFALAGIALLARKLSGNRLPKWLVSVAAGVGLIGFTIWSEYDWFSRVSGELPEGVEVVWHAEQAMPLRPWTYLAPITTKFVAMDRRAMAQHPNNADLRMARLYNFARWQPVVDGLMIFDCAGGRQVMVQDGVEITPDGQLNGAEWATPAADDAFQNAACRAQ